MAQRHLCIFDISLRKLAGDLFPAARLKPVEIPNELYKEFIRLYHRSMDLYEKLSRVLKDGEHELIMEEGRTQHYNLPPDGYLDEDLNELRDCLKSFDPWRVSYTKEGKVNLTQEQVEGFFSLFAKDYDVFHKVTEAVRDTDYFDYLRYLRDEAEVCYAGPSSLREVAGIYFGIARAHNRQMKYLAELGVSP